MSKCDTTLINEGYLKYHLVFHLCGVGVIKKEYIGVNYLFEGFPEINTQTVTIACLQNRISNESFLPLDIRFINELWLPNIFIYRQGIIYITRISLYNIFLFF